MNVASPEPGTPAVSTLDPPALAVASRYADLVALTKPRLNCLVVLTTLAGYYMGSAGYDLALLFHTVVGTALVAGGAAAFNQLLERDTDALMRRTQTRPLPGGRLEPGVAGAFATALSVFGLGQLAVGVNLLAAGVAAVTLVSYLTIYTPLKRRTPLATLVGGVPGALPAVIGWAAARNSLSVEGWALFGLVFFWQMPHFLAIAWMCRDDYARAGLPMLPVVEPSGRSTGIQVVLYAATLIPVSLLPSLLGLTGRWYLAGALLLGLAFLALGVEFARRRNEVSARRLFFASITYLPLVLGLLLGNRA